MVLRKIILVVIRASITFNYVKIYLHGRQVAQISKIIPVYLFFKRLSSYYLACRGKTERMQSPTLPS